MDAILNITLSTGRTYAWQNANLWQDANQRASMFARFWAKVQRADAKACWLWTGGGNGRGYGLFCIGIGHVRVPAHKFAWLASRGDIPDGLEVCHRCDVTRCVNPDHLFLGTHQENHLDSVRKGRKKAWGLQKLNADQVLEIRARVASGRERHKDIAADYGIARHSVGQIANRTTWAHLPDGFAAARQAS
jgi:hypothetical protein